MEGVVVPVNQLEQRLTRHAHGRGEVFRNVLRHSEKAKVLARWVRVVVASIRFRNLRIPEREETRGEQVKGLRHSDRRSSPLALTFANLEGLKERLEQRPDPGVVLPGVRQD